MSDGTNPGQDQGRANQDSAQVTLKVEGEHRRTVEMKLELSGDAILAQIKAHQEQTNDSVPQIPRCPDVRGVVVNLGPQDVVFFNPGGHSDKPECIKPGEACMVMFKGDSLSEQLANAREAFETYTLGEGISAGFIMSLSNCQLISECYGPAVFGDQAARLTPQAWTDADGRTTEVAPAIETFGAYGVRPPANEEVYELRLSPEIYSATLQGTGTSAENFKGGCIYMAVSKDYKTGQIRTRPIVPARAREFYGEHITEIPRYVVKSDGSIVKDDKPRNDWTSC